MKSLLLICLVFIPTVLQAKTARLFSIYRTNYYSDRSIAYDLQYDSETCRITDPQPIRTYFISSSSGAKLSNSLSGYNRDYFSARSLSSINAQTLSFKFKAINELEALLGSSLKIQVELIKNGANCTANTIFLSSGKLFFRELQHIDVEFVLQNFMGLGEHPQGISWVRLRNPKQKKCLFGKCK